MRVRDIRTKRDAVVLSAAWAFVAQLAKHDSAFLLVEAVA
jgi:hypothetical protein